MKLWAGRFTAATNDLVEQFNASIFFDRALYLDDLVGSAAHVRMLHRIGVLSADEAAEILGGLRQVLGDFERGEVTLSAQDEDIHMAAEIRLKEKIGAVAGKLHTGRSRNDQVALDIHLFCRRVVVDIVEHLQTFIEVLIEKAEAHTKTILPGYTHLQRAQPVLLAHHLLAYVSQFTRDAQRLRDLFPRVNTMPLGAGALAGSTFPLDRRFVKELLQFDSLYTNSMDAVSDRDFLVEFQSCAALIMVHLSRLSEELILWSSKEFDFVELSDSFSTGSSMMPQKKNPDVAELVRGKTGRVVGSLMGLLTTLKGLPLTYNKDMQEDKEGFFDTVTTIALSLRLYAPMVQGMTVKVERMRNAAEDDFSNTTDLADYLVRKQLPFRDAHEVVGKLVRLAIDKGCVLNRLTLEEFRQCSPLFDEEVFEVLDIEKVVARRVSEGGTSEHEVLRQLEGVKATLDGFSAWTALHRARVDYDLDTLFTL